MYKNIAKQQKKTTLSKVVIETSNYALLIIDCISLVKNMPVTVAHALKSP